MSNVYAVVEGKGEKTFLESVLVPYLAEKSIWLRVALVGKPGRKGGVRKWAVVKKDIIQFLKQEKPERPVYVTTMFDFYRMPAKWPGRREAGEKDAVSAKAATVEDELAKDIEKAMGPDFDQRKFIPYVQMHEFEALILAQPMALKSEFPERTDEVASIIAEIGEEDPEAIDDNPETAPSTRIIKRIPEYGARKASAAPNVLEEIGLETLLNRCKRFCEWLQKLASLRNAI